MILKESIQQIIIHFGLLSSWEEKYEYIIGLGDKMPDMEKKYKTKDYLVRGCQSKVWLRCVYKNKKLYFCADSDALISKGIVALVVQLYSGLTAKAILDENGAALSEMGLQKHLSMNRASGLNMMLVTIKNYALKYCKDE